MIHNQQHPGKNLFIYILILTLLTAGLISLNAVLGMPIPFSVNLLIGFVGASLVFVISHSVLTKGWKTTLWLFSLSFLIAFSAEALGVNFGWIFGSYHYTGMLGVQFLGVSFLAALAWEPILYASYAITDMLVHPNQNASQSLTNRILSYIGMALIGAVATTAWDLMIDPIAVSEGWWVWHGGGEYIPYLQNGVPIQNYIGWLLVAFVIQLTYRFITGKQPKSMQNNPYLSIYGPLTLYSSLFISSFGVTITILNRPEIALIGMMAMGPFIFLCLFNIYFIKELLQARYEKQPQKL